MLTQFSLDLATFTHIRGNLNGTNSKDGEADGTFGDHMTLGRSLEISHHVHYSLIMNLQS